MSVFYKRNPRRFVIYIILYQNEIDKQHVYMKVNGLELSSEKTNVILFNNASGPKELPQFKLHGQELLYKSEVKFLGVYLTSKLKSRKSIRTLYYLRQGKVLIC